MHHLGFFAHIAFDELAPKRAINEYTHNLYHPLHASSPHPTTLNRASTPKTENSFHTIYTVILPFPLYMIYTFYTAIHSPTTND